MALLSPLGSISGAVSLNKANLCVLHLQSQNQSQAATWHNTLGYKVLLAFLRRKKLIFVFHTL